MNTPRKVKKIAVIYKYFAHISIIQVSIFSWTTKWFVITLVLHSNGMMIKGTELIVRNVNVR